MPFKLPPTTCNMSEGPVVPMPTLPEEVQIPEPGNVVVAENAPVVAEMPPPNVDTEPLP